MAPPPSGSLPLQQRLLQLAQTLQFAWFVGHLTLLFCIVRYGLSYITFNYYSRWAQFSYRTAFISAGVTYGIVVYKAFRARSRAGSRAPSGVISLAADENVQYLAMALVWLFSPQYPLAMLPFGVYSIFHVATYTRTNLIPTVQPPQPAAPVAGASPGAKPAFKNNPTADMIGKFVKEYYDTSMGLVAILEILLWGRILLSAVAFSKGSWILIAVYTAFLRARFAQSSFVQGQFRNLEARIDSVVGGQGTPPVARTVWDTVKGGARSFHDATDIGKYVGGAPAQKKAT
ncbi:Nucleoporin [Lachnellula cervina]|uniref:Nucleoporin n=1 Tax=Lachnellula cervina TaxID=1316786 RepID=A0A7D8YLJ8_9HELO|nr:Nucleoporin [Lachnellula cervina]